MFQSERRRKCCFMKGAITFYASGPLSHYCSAIGIGFWRTNYYFKWSYSPASCQILELSAIWWYFLINSLRVPFNNGQHNHGCRRLDVAKQRENKKTEIGWSLITHIKHLTSPWGVFTTLLSLTGALSEILLAHSTNGCNKSTGIW